MYTNKLYYLLSRDRRGVFATNSNKCTLKNNKTKENKKKKKKKKHLTFVIPTITPISECVTNAHQYILLSNCLT